MDTINTKDFSKKTSAVRMRKYYNSLEGDKKAQFIRKVMEYERNRYNTDETFKQKVCEKKKAKYELQIKTNPQIMEKRRINAYVYGLNMKLKAGMEVHKTKKFDEYDVFYCEQLGTYMSKRLLSDEDFKQNN